MNIRAKTVTPILLLLIVVLLVLTMSSLFLLKKEKESKAAVEKRLEQAEKMVETLQVKLDDANKLVLQLNEAGKDTEGQIESLTKELLRAKDNTSILMAERDNLKSELDNLKASNNEILGRLNNAQKDLEDVQLNLKSITQEKEGLEKKLKDLQASGVDLDKIVVNYTQATEGQVMTVNKEYNFIVTNLGQRDDIQLGQVFYLYQGDNLIGELNVEKVEEALSVATPQGADMISVVKEGDIVKTKK